MEECNDFFCDFQYHSLWILGNEDELMVVFQGYSIYTILNPIRWNNRSNDKKRNQKMDKHKTLKKYFGYDEFREGQELLIDSILKGMDVLGIMPTGAGKSLCYQLPALLLPGITLVISPLISLMKDQVQTLNQAGIHAAFINSSLTENQIRKALTLAAEGQYKIIYVAPERLETSGFMEFAMKAEISMVTVDEAHCISQWGQDFRPSYLKIVEFIKKLSCRPVISGFTATATETVKEDILCVLGLHNPRVLVTGFDRKNLYFAVERPRKKDAYVLDYVRNHSEECGIIYCATRKNVESVCEMLKENGMSAIAYHAGLGNEERKINQDDFIYDRKQVIVATNAFGMGIDKSNVRYVIHYNMPQNLENYYQEAGRAGRDGEPSECILLYSPQDIMINRFLMEYKEANLAAETDISLIQERDEERLQIMSHYCMTTNCLREYILRYFGEKSTDQCGNCSNCMMEYEEVDMTEEAAKIIACVSECGQRYGINVVSGILCGNNTAKLREYGVLSLESYGSLGKVGEGEVKKLINQMILEGILSVTKDKYALIRLGSLAKDVHRGERKVILKLLKDKPVSAHDYENRSSKKQRKSDVLNSRGLTLFDKLRELRREIAKEENMPPYIIFSDKTLVDMCVKIPFNRKEMLEVLGVGENKFKKYGERFLEKIEEFTGGKKEKLFFGDHAEMMKEADRRGDTTESGSRTAYKAKTKKEEFYITPEMESRIVYTDSCLITELASQLNDLRDPLWMKKTSGVQFARWLIEEGYIEEKFEDGKWRKVVLEKGAQIDIKPGMRISAKGTEYEDLYYGKKAQRIIVESLKKLD